MYEFVYKLDLPPLTDIISPDSEILKSTSRYSIYKSIDILKPEYMYFNGMRFNNAVLLYRNLGDLDKSTIHSDRTFPGSCPWAINWVHGGHGTLEFWLPNQIESVTRKFQEASHNTGTLLEEIKTTQLPYRVYEQPPGVYLVNTNEFHRAKGWNSRLVLSLRSTSNFSFSWEEVVEKFKHLIISK